MVIELFDLIDCMLFYVVLILPIININISQIVSYNGGQYWFRFMSQVIKKIPCTREPGNSDSSPCQWPMGNGLYKRLSVGYVTGLNIWWWVDYWLLIIEIEIDWKAQY